MNECLGDKEGEPFRGVGNVDGPNVNILKHSKYTNRVKLKNSLKSIASEIAN